MGTLVYKYRGGDCKIFKRDLNTLEENYFFAPNFKMLNDPSETMVFTDNFEDQTSLISKLLNNNTKQYLNTVKEAFANLIDRKNRIGIYSLSKNYTDELLWSHYANAHYGFCIEYDLDILIDTYKRDKIYSFPVSYSNTPPRIGLTEVYNPSKDVVSIIKLIAGNKSKNWEYEDEHRLIIDRFGVQAYDFQAVKSIYFGLRMDDENKESIMNQLKGRGINYYQMVQVDKSYNFEAKPINDINDTRLTYLKEIPSEITNVKAVKYTIDKKDYDWVLGKAEIKITLEVEINKTALKWLAELIRSHIFKQAERIFMFYYIKGKDENGMCWATSHFSTEKIEVSINDF